MKYFIQDFDINSMYGTLTEINPNKPSVTASQAVGYYNKQWNELGDCVDDPMQIIINNYKTGNDMKEILIENSPVKAYQNPRVNLEQVCMKCKRKMKDHGMIPSQLNYMVCPGDYVIEKDGRFSVYSEQEFILEHAEEFI